MRIIFLYIYKQVSPKKSGPVKFITLASGAQNLAYNLYLQYKKFNLFGGMVG